MSAAPTIPAHSSDDRRIQINQAGSWSTMLRFNEKKGIGYVDEVLHVAEELACLVEGATMRLLDEVGAVLLRWSPEQGWYCP